MTRKLLVEGLDWGIDGKALRAAFAPFGRVVDAVIAQDWETGRSRGFGHVTFDDETAARLARETMDGAQLAGKTLRVNIAPEVKKKSVYHGGDYGYAKPQQEAATYRGGDYSPSQDTPPTGRHLFRDPEYGYVDGPTPPTDYRSADFDGGVKKPRRTTSPPESPADLSSAGEEADPSEGSVAEAGEAQGDPGEGGDAGNEDSKKPAGWTSDNAGFGGTGSKTFG